MPRAAQWMPDQDQFMDDQSIDLNILECVNCNLVQTDAEPVSYYKDVITTQAIGQESRSKFLAELRPVAEHLRSVSNGRALEIGSGKGDFLPVLEAMDLEAMGLEHDPSSVRDANSAGHYTRQGYLLDLTKKELGELGVFHLVVVNNFLEHQPDVGEFLRRARLLLTEGGILYVSVPSLERIEEADCMHEFVADHLVYFTEETLRRAFDLSGLRCTGLYTKHQGNDLVAIGVKRERRQYQEMSSRFSNLKSSVSSFISKRKSEGHEIAVWGAGHRALALMALANVQQISFVIDSAEFKQGRYTPILRKEIISPHQIIEKGVTLILLMLPGELNGQVYNSLKKTFNYTGSVYLFDDKNIVRQQ